MNKYNPLPVLDRKTGSRPRLAATPSNTKTVETTLKNEEDIVNTMTMNPHIPPSKPVYAPQKNFSAAARAVGKSLPRLGNGKKLEKIHHKFKNGEDQDIAREDTNSTPGRKDEDDVTNNQTSGGVLLKFFAKTQPGFSEGKTKTNQDSIFVSTSIKDSNKATVFAVFDGHGTFGHKVSGFLKDKLLGRLVHKDKKP